MRRKTIRFQSRVKLSPEFKQDIVGVLLIALGAFILVSNMSSATGAIGLYVIKTFLRSWLGIGIYVLPLFIALYGLILLLRHEIKELAVRLIGLLILFITFVTIAQFYAPLYFEGEENALFAGAGGLLGYGNKILLEKTIGATGSYILLSALAVISFILIFNLTIASIFKFIFNLFSAPFRTKTESKKMQPLSSLAHFDEPQPEEKKDKQSIPAMLAMLKDLKPKQLPLPEMEIEEKEKKAHEGTRSEKGQRAEKAKKFGAYKLPPIDLLDDATEKEKQREAKFGETTELRKKILEEALRNFGIGATVVGVNQGPAVTRFEIQLEPGVKVSRVFSLADDIALSLAAGGVRMEGPVPGKSVIGIEVPNSSVTPVRLKEIVKRVEFQRNNSKLFIGLGQDLGGLPVYGDLVKMPHLLIAGTTGSGKSVCLNSLIISILLRARPDEVKIMMIDPKMVEFSSFDGIPHLLAPVVTDAKRASVMMKEWVIKEMNQRYKTFFDAGVRNIGAYNAKVDADDKMPLIVVIVDELADLMMVAATDVETSICRIAQMARATGIHLVIATQRPSVDVITGLIKANIPSRIAFAVATQIDSRVIMDMSGAEKLLGRGDMLYNPVGAMKPVRLQGSFVTDSEIEKVVKFIKEQAKPEYAEDLTSIKVEIKGEGAGAGAGRDDLFIEAVKLIIASGIASTSYLQRKMRIGYNRAARLMDEIEAAGLVSASEGDSKPRKVIASQETLKSLGV